MRWSGGPAESFTWTIGKRPGQRAKYASGSCPPLVIQYRSTSSWTSLGSVSASSTSYGNFPSSGANSKSWRSEEHTSELQSHSDLVCRLLLEKKNSNDGPHAKRTSAT